MRIGWNPTRRNRNIGTKAQGHGANNKLVIPESWHSLTCYWERLQSYVVIRRKIGTKEQLFFVEPTKPGWCYPCTIDDIEFVLNYCGPEDTASFDFIVMRQPTRKQTSLRPVWGRAQFAFDLDGFQGSAVIIEAQSLSSITWDKSLSTERARELKRLISDGHHVITRRRDILISPSPSSLRNTVLFRTLLHEIGHHVDHRHTEPDEWLCKTHQEKEDFAHRYAESLSKALQEDGFIPFPPLINEASFEQDRIKLEWFVF